MAASAWPKPFGWRLRVASSLWGLLVFALQPSLGSCKGTFGAVVRAGTGCRLRSCHDGVPVLRLAGGVDYSKWDAFGDDEESAEGRDEGGSPSLTEKTAEDIATQSDLRAVLQGASQSIKETRGGQDSFAQRIMREVEEDDDPEWLTVLAALYCANGVENKTDALLARAIGLDPLYTPALLFRGRFAACIRGELGEAEKLLASAVEADPRDEEAKEALGHILSLSSKGEEGRTKEEERKILVSGLRKCRQDMQDHIERISAGIEKLQQGVSLKNTKDFAKMPTHVPET